MITDGYDRCRQWKLPSMPNHERKIYHPDEFRQRPTPRYKLREWMVGGAWVQFGSGDMEDGITFGCFLVCLVSSSLLWISARYKWHRHGFLPPANGGGVSPGTGSAERSP